jgi:deoxyribonuclease-4
MTQRRRIGAHIPSTELFDAAKARGADAAQIFLGDPQKWTKPEVLFEGGATALREAAEAADVDLYVHAPYIINVASSNNRIRIPSRKLLQQTVTLAGEVGAKGVIVHGGHVTKDEEPQIGLDNWVKAMERLEPGAPVLIENTAGGNHAMARTLEMLGRLFHALDGLDAGFCLDTCHAHAAGIDLTKGVGQILEATGRIDLVHVNDSLGEFGSGQDRHANIGDGTIGAETIGAVVKESGAPGICETRPEGQAQDIEFLRLVVDAA